MAKKEKIKKPLTKKRKKKIIRLVVSLSVVAALVICGFIFVPDLLANDETSETILQKRTAAVVSGDVVKTIGSSAPLESSESLIYKPEESSEVQEILIEDGDLALKGEVIMTLDTSQIDENIENLESQIETKQEQISDKEDQIEDKNDAIEDKKEDIADKWEDISEYEDSISDLEADIEENESGRTDLNIYSPIDGAIFDIKVEVGDTVNENTVLATITNPEVYEVELPFTAAILEEDIEEVRIYYKNNRLDAEIVSIADYIYKDKFSNDLVDVLITFSTDIALPEKDEVEGIIYLEFLSYHSTENNAPYFAATEQITAGISGEILELNLIEKQSVETGDLLAVIDGTSIDNTTEALNNQIDSFEEQIENAKDMIAGYYENIDTYHEDIADINDEITDLMEDITDLEEDIEEAKESYENAEIVAEFDGIVSNMKVSAGDSVTANTTLFTLISLDNPSLVVAIDELDITQLKEGQEAEVTIDALEYTEDTPVKAVVTNISLQGNYQGGVTTFDVTVMLTEPVEDLKLSMNATATIYIDKSEDTLYIPIEAVTLQGGKSFVYVQDASAAGTPVINNNKNTGTSENQPAAGGQVSSDNQAAGGARQGGMRQGGNFNTDDMTDEQKAAMQERLASMGITQDQAQSASESVSDIASYYEGTRLVEITTGVYNELYIEVLSGIEEGDIIVLPPLYTSSSTTSSDSNTGMMMPGIGGSFGGGTGMNRVPGTGKTGGN